MQFAVCGSLSGVLPLSVVRCPSVYDAGAWVMYGVLLVSVRHGDPSAECVFYGVPLVRRRGPFVLSRSV